MGNWGIKTDPEVQTIILDGLVPSKKNSRINTKSGRSFPSKSYQTWHAKAMQQLQFQRAERYSKDVQLYIKIDFVFATRSARDVTNKAESIMDLFVDYGLIPDDEFKVAPIVLLSGRYEKGKHRTTVTIRSNTPDNQEIIDCINMLFNNPNPPKVNEDIF